MASRAHEKRLLERYERELIRRTKRPWAPLEILYPQQREVFCDTTRDRCYEGTRQLGKSLEAAVELIDNAIQKPGSQSAFLDFDKEHAGKIVLRDFETLLEKYDVAAVLVGGELHFDNGSIVYVFSGRASEIKKLQGLKLSLLVADECNDADALEEIFKMVRPALMRYGGRILAMGIPGRVAGIGFWWRITHGDLSAHYGQHVGHMRNNPYLDPADIATQRARAAAEQGEDSADFVRHWDGLWPQLDDKLRVFRYFPDVNGYDGEPPDCAAYSLGLDPGGVQDAEAIAIAGHNPGRGEIWIVDEDDTGRGKGSDWDATTDRVGAMEDRWHPRSAFYDYGSAKKALALVMDNDRRRVLEPVPMKDLDVEIPRVNRLFMLGLLKVRRGSKLEQDLLYTTWDAKERARGKNKYSSAWKQNLCDAMRAALWDCEGYANPPDAPETDRERKQRTIREAIEATEQTSYSQLVDSGVTTEWSD